MEYRFDQNDKEAAKAEINKSLKALFAYTRSSILQMKCNAMDYPKAAVHKRIHQDLLTRLTEFAEDFEKEFSSNF